MTNKKHDTSFSYRSIIGRSVRCCLVFILSLLTYSLTHSLTAVEIHPNAGTTSAAFLKLGLGSRAVSLGGAFTGLADDVSALYWNPAGLARLDGRQVSFTHNESFEGIRHDFLGYAQPISRGVLAAGLYGLYTPNDLERRSGSNEADPFEPISPVEGYFRSYDMAAHVSYARAFRENLYLGASVKFIRQTIDTVSADSVAADLGALYRFQTLPLSIGFTARHMGLPVKFRETAYALPFNLGCGAAWRWNPKLVTTLDLNKPVDNFLSVSAGTEYLPFEMLAVRAGYRYRLGGLELGDLAGLSAGIGFNVPLRETGLRVDYAFIPFGALGNSHRVSVSLLFSPDKPRRRAERPAEKTIAAAPAAPAAPALRENPMEGYDLHDATVTCRPIMANGRMRVLAVSIVSGGSDLVSCEGLLRNAAMKRCSIAEKKGEGPVYKHFAFTGDMTAPPQNVTCRLRLPKDVARPLVVTESGTRIEPARTGEDGSPYLYQFTLGTLEPFRVESR